MPFVLINICPVKNQNFVNDLIDLKVSFISFFIFRDGTVQYGNIMYDRRVVRGNTYAQHTLPAVSQL